MSWENRSVLLEEQVSLSGFLTSVLFSTLSCLHAAWLMQENKAGFDF